MGGRLGISFAAGFVSVVLPCVLPLVPGYLSAISAVEVDRLGERGVGRRIVTASVPFIVGFSHFLLEFLVFLIATRYVRVTPTDAKRGRIRRAERRARNAKLAAVEKASSASTSVKT